jgi:hypothetical protein
MGNRQSVSGGFAGERYIAPIIRRGSSAINSLATSVNSPVSRLSTSHNSRRTRNRRPSTLVRAPSKDAWEPTPLLSRTRKRAWTVHDGLAFIADIKVGMGRTNEERKYLEKKSNGKLQGEILKSNKFQASVKRHWSTPNGPQEMDIFGRTPQESVLDPRARDVGIEEKEEGLDRVDDVAAVQHLLPGAANLGVPDPEGVPEPHLRPCAGIRPGLAEERRRRRGAHAADDGGDGAAKRD